MRSFDLEMVQGDDLRVFCRVVDNIGDSIDLSSAQSISYAISKGFDTPILVSRTIGNGISLSAADEFFLDITSTNTGGLAAGAYRHEAEVITSGGFVYTIFQGVFRIRPQIIK